METIKQATAYLCENIKNMSNEELDDVDQDIIHDTLVDGLLEKYESRLNELDADLITQDFMENDDALEAFLKVKFSDYRAVLEEVVKEILADYLVEDQTAAE